MNLKAITPIGSMLEDCRAYVARKIQARVLSRFPAMTKCFWEKTKNCTNDDQGEQIRKRIASGFIALLTPFSIGQELAQ